MKKLSELKTTADLVKAILQEDERARNNDGILYSRVCEVIGARVGLNLNDMSVTRFFYNLTGLTAFPAPETVRRARQKIQATHPELAASERVQRARGELEPEFRAFAREGM